MIGERSVGGDRPPGKAALPVIRDGARHVCHGGIAIRVGNRRTGHQSGHLGGDGGGGKAALLFPPLGAEPRPVSNQEIDRRPDVILVEDRVCHAELVRHHDRVGHFVELRIEGVRRDLAVQQAVARHRAIGKLLPVE